MGASGEDAAVVATDPTDGLARCLGLVPVLCVVGVARETCLGEDANGARTTRTARRARNQAADAAVRHAVDSGEADWKQLRELLLPFALADAATSSVRTESETHAPSPEHR